MADNISLPSVSFFSYIKAFFSKIQLIFGGNIIKTVLKSVVAVCLIFFIVASINKAIEKSKTEQTQSATTTNPQVQATPETKSQEKGEESKPIEKSPQENKEQIFTALIDNAIKYINEGKHDMAIEEATRAIILDFDNAYAYHVRGMIYQQSGLNKNAEDDFKIACSLGSADSCRELKKLAQ